MQLTDAALGFDHPWYHWHRATSSDRPPEADGTGQLTAGVSQKEAKSMHPLSGLSLCAVVGAVALTPQPAAGCSVPLGIRAVSPLTRQDPANAKIILEFYWPKPEARSQALTDSFGEKTFRQVDHLGPLFVFSPEGVAPDDQLKFFGESLHTSFDAPEGPRDTTSPAPPTFAGVSHAAFGCDDREAAQTIGLHVDGEDAIGYALYRAADSEPVDASIDKAELLDPRPDDGDGCYYSRAFDIAFNFSEPSETICTGCTCTTAPSPSPASLLGGVLLLACRHGRRAKRASS